MEKLIIQGGTSLQGEISASGSKNAALPILAATLLCEGPTTVTNLPHLQDVITSIELLGALGVEVGEHQQHRIEVDAGRLDSLTAPYDLVRKMRASILVLGPLLSRWGEANVSFPGGCAIGSRPVDLHLQGLEAMGATIVIEDGYIRATRSGRLVGCRMSMSTVSVRAPEKTRLQSGKPVAEKRKRACDQRASMAPFISAAFETTHTRSPATPVARPITWHACGDV